jgi:hypothetical protein
MRQLGLGLVVVTIFVLLLNSVEAGSQSGICYSEPDLMRIMAQWREIVTDASRSQGTVERHYEEYSTERGDQSARTYSHFTSHSAWGCFTYCVPAGNRSVLVWAASWGHRTPQDAERQALIQLSSRTSNCFRQPAVILREGSP